MTSADALAGLFKWLRHEEWHDAFEDMLDLHVARVCVEAGIPMQDLGSLIGEHHATVLWGCAFEDLMTRALDDGRNIVDEYLKRRGWKERPLNRAYMTALRSSVMSLYEVSDIVPEVSFLARDLVRGGEPVRVRERLGTRCLKPWDRIAARIVQVGPRTEMAGGSLPLEHDTCEKVLTAFCHAARKARAEWKEFSSRLDHESDSAAPDADLTDTEILRSSTFLFTNIWLADLLQRILHPTLPKVCNTDGDELAFTSVSWPIKPEAGAGAIRLALDAVPGLRPASETFWNWIGAQEPAGNNGQGQSRILVTRLDDGSITLGTIELKDTTLLLEANSTQRAQRGRALIEPVLEGLLDEPTVESRTIADLRASPPAPTPKPLFCGLTPAEERAIVQASLDRHYANLLDQPVPMLGNITPRRAAKSVNEREKLVTWLKRLENTTARHDSGSPIAGYDASWIWEELGVAALRR